MAKLVPGFVDGHLLKLVARLRMYDSAYEPLKLAACIIVCEFFVPPLRSTSQRSPSFSRGASTFLSTVQVGGLGNVGPPDDTYKHPEWNN